MSLFLQPPAPQTLAGFERIFRYFDRQERKTMVKILPGEYYLTSSREELIVTTLGSCISVCIQDAEARLGGMNHFMLPGLARVGDGAFPVANSGNNYGVFAMESLINSIMKHGGRRSKLKLKVTGGSRIGSGSGNVSTANIAFIQRFLKQEGFCPEAVDVGGSCPRKVRFDPATGQMWVRKLASVRDPQVIEREEQYLETLEKTPVTGSVELFSDDGALWQR